MLLENRISLKDSALTIMYERINIAEEIHKTYQRDSALYETEIIILHTQIKDLKKDLKKQKRKTFTSRIALAGAIVVGAYIILKP